MTIHGMRESTVYQEILREGEAKGKIEGKAEGKNEGIAEGKTVEARRLLRLAGEKLHGPIPAGCAARLEALADTGEIETLFQRAFAAHGWDELLGA